MASAVNRGAIREPKVNIKLGRKPILKAGGTYFYGPHALGSDLRVCSRR